MASSAPKVYRDTGTALEIPDDKNEAFKTVAAHYACSARMGPKIVSCVPIAGGLDLTLGPSSRTLSR